MPDLTISGVDRVLYSTQDPTTEMMHGRHLPAMTTLLYRVCQNDTVRFDEAVRLVELFIAQAISQTQAAAEPALAEKPSAWVHQLSDIDGHCTYSNVDCGDGDGTWEPLYKKQGVPSAVRNEDDPTRDYPAEFEAWWATHPQRNRDAADYPAKKQIAFDAFYFAARHTHFNQEPAALAHVTSEDDGLYAKLEVLDGTHLQPSMSPVKLYVHPILEEDRRA